MRELAGGTIAQGMVEMSNVQVVEEMVSLILAQRAYEVNAKAIQAAEEGAQVLAVERFLGGGATRLPIFPTC